jgi:hypothetical protein
MNIKKCKSCVTDYKSNIADYKEKIRQYIIDPTETSLDKNSMNIFYKPIEKIFLWKSDIDDAFFVLFKYNNIFFSLQDKQGEILNLLDENIDDETFYEIMVYLMKSMKIYKSLRDITFTEFENDNLIYDFNKYVEFLC